MTNKKILLVVFILLNCLFLIISLTNIYISNAKNAEVFYFEDLEIGDYIPNGSTLLTKTSYAVSGESNDSINVYFYDKSEKAFVLSKNYSVVVPNAENANGWYLVYIGFGDPYFYPEKNEELLKKEIKEPNIDNRYKIEGNDSIYNQYSFYKIENTEILDPIIDNKGQPIGWKKDDKICGYELNSGVDITLRNPNEPTMTYDIDIKRGQTVKFKLKNMFLSNYIKILLNDQEIALSSAETTSLLNNNCIYNDWYITVNDDGKVDICDTKGRITKTDIDGINSEGKLKLSFKIKPLWEQKDIYKIKETYYCYVKDFRVLTKINDGAELDSTKVNDGDKIYWEAISLNSANKDGEFIYKK